MNSVKLQKLILLMGPPGSGKGTQSDLLADKFNYAHFSMGNALRDFAKGDTEMAHRIKQTIDAGIIVNDEDARMIFLEEIGKLSNKFEGIILDGFPRTLGQMADVDEAIKRYEIKSYKVFFLGVDREKLIDRLGKRKTCSVCKRIFLPGVFGYDTDTCSFCGGRLEIRDDDNAEGVAKRFDEYIKKTADVKNAYESKGMLIKINGDQPIEKVHEDIIKSLKE
ncbi:MAG: nucleoside monophosphate kinase [Candidatus Doudnabacteria bacterium]|nr:nucleoside monophosphate kinase [Candidatus Doudnabacteria bacterium]